MGVIAGPCHAATMVTWENNLPFCFADHAATQQIADRGNWKPDLPAHFVPGTNWTPTEEQEHG